MTVILAHDTRGYRETCSCVSLFIIGSSVLYFTGLSMRLFA